MFFSSAVSPVWLGELLGSISPRRMAGKFVARVLVILFIGDGPLMISSLPGSCRRGRMSCLSPICFWRAGREHSPPNRSHCDSGAAAYRRMKRVPLLPTAPPGKPR